MRLLRYLMVSGSAALLTGAVTLSAATVTTATPARAGHAVPYSARFITEARTVLASYLRHSHPQAMLVHPGRASADIASTTPVGTFNWAGYVDVSSTNGAFTKVSGSWVTPSVTCGAEDQITSEWVGLDGFSNSSTVEQLGTVSWCFQGSPIYFTWYEMFPAGLVKVGTTLAPGDKISASVSRAGSTYTLKLTDATHTANSFTTTATCKTTVCVDNSAEWISERPGFSIGTAPQAQFNSFKITNAAETANGKAGTIGSFPANDSITMVDATDTYDLATVSSLNPAGNSFSATWKNSY